MLGVDVHGLGIGRGVTERLHGQVGREAQASQVLQFIASHGAGGVLGTYSGHLGFAVGAGADAVSTAGLADHLLARVKPLH